jgi:hypothetical protein
MIPAMADTTVSGIFSYFEQWRAWILALGTSMARKFTVAAFLRIYTGSPP